MAVSGGRNVFYEGITLGFGGSFGRDTSERRVYSGRVWGWAKLSLVTIAIYGSVQSGLAPTMHGSPPRRTARGEETVNLELNSGSIPGNGLAAFNSRSLKIVVHGGAQDGVGKGSLGGSVL